MQRKDLKIKKQSYAVRQEGGKKQAGKSFRKGNLSEEGTEKSRPKNSRPKNRSRCPVSGKCGGCTMVDVPYEEQLLKKQRIVEEAIGTFGPVEQILKMKNHDHYRNKVTSAVSTDRRGNTINGVFRAGSREVVPVQKCMLENTEADRVIMAVMSLLPSFRILPYDEATGKGLLRYIQVRTAHVTRQVMLTLVTSSPVFPAKNNFVEALLKLRPEITTIVQNINDRTDSLVIGDREKVLFGPGYIEDVLCGRRFRISSASFYQVNSLQTEKLYNIAADYAGLSGKETILDAYCGIGTIGLIASSRAGRLVGVEANSRAVADAVGNAALNKVENSVFICADAAEFMEEAAEAGEHYDVLFMDPPRAGASEKFLQAACRMAPDKIVYVSCEPSTLGRDLEYLTAAGYRMKKAQPVDMFPYVEKVETVALLSKLDVDKHIDVEIKLDELDLTSTESKAMHKSKNIY